MTSQSYFKQLAVRCSYIAGKASDAEGFVTVRSLVNQFGARLVIRPLLVEAMIASSSDMRDGSQHRWCVLLDRETHDLTDQEIANEAMAAPLSPRLRNTVAHELAHSLAFNPKEFGVVFQQGVDSKETKEEFVKGIERHTEMLSPLLLLPDAVLDRLFSAKLDFVPITELCNAVRILGVSRYVFVNRLNLLNLLDSRRIRARDCFQNFAIGIGEWLSECEANLKAWPLFWHFEGGKVPNFVFQWQKQVPLSSASFSLSNTGFYLAGGESESVEVIVPAGTPRNPAILKIPIRLSVEKCARRRGNEFLFTVKARP